MTSVALISLIIIKVMLRKLCVFYSTIEHYQLKCAPSFCYAICIKKTAYIPIEVESSFINPSLSVRNVGFILCDILGIKMG